MDSTTQDNKKSSICLVMIVKNESKNIERCLNSVKDYIDYWVICDTGSTDGTQDIIRNYMESQNIPGDLYEREWKDYGTNRTESMKLSQGKCDYRLIIDADDLLVVNEPEKIFANLTHDSYRLRIELGLISYYRTQLVKSDQDWKYVGVLHEYIEGPKDVELTDEYIYEGYMVASVSGDTRDIKGNNKYHNDALIFERELMLNPDIEPGLRARYQFYLAQSYRDAGMHERSIEAYRKRIELGGRDEEVYISLYTIAKMYQVMKKSDSEIVDAYLRAWEYRPVRLEAVYNLIRYLVKHKRYFLAFSFASICMRLPTCTDVLFVESDIWIWKMAEEYSVLSYYTGNIKEAYLAAKSVVNLPEFAKFSDSEKERITKNLETFEKSYNDLLEKTANEVK